MIVQEEYDLGTEASVTWLACKMQRKILSSVKKNKINYGQLVTQFFFVVIYDKS